MKNQNNKPHSGAKAKVALAATMMTIPMVAAPQKASAQEAKTDAPLMTKRAESVHLYLKYSDMMEKHKGGVEIVGVEDRHVVYKNTAGDLFWIDPATGDQRSLSSDYYMKIKSNRSSGYMKYHGIKGESNEHKQESKVTLLGVDAKGNVVQQNARGEKFYLNASTGDMVFVK